jgi:hypothetical protein
MRYHLWQRNPAKYIRTVEQKLGGQIEYDPKTEVLLTETGVPVTDSSFKGHLTQRRDFFVQEPVKFDEGKNRLDLMPTEALEQVGRVYTYGANKYHDHNWRGGLKFSRLYGATLRHLFAFWRGEDADSESGLPHLAHATFGLLGLLQYSLEGRKGLDDRWTTLDTRNEEKTEDKIREVGSKGPSETLVAECRKRHPEFGVAILL